MRLPFVAGVVPLVTFPVRVQRCLPAETFAADVAAERNVICYAVDADVILVVIFAREILFTYVTP